MIKFGLWVVEKRHGGSEQSLLSAGNWIPNIQYKAVRYLRVTSSERGQVIARDRPGSAAANELSLSIREVNESCIGGRAACVVPSRPSVARGPSCISTHRLQRSSSRDSNPPTTTTIHRGTAPGTGVCIRSFRPLHHVRMYVGEEEEEEAEIRFPLDDFARTWLKSTPPGEGKLENGRKRKKYGRSLNAGAHRI